MVDFLWTRAAGQKRGGIRQVVWWAMLVIWLADGSPSPAWAAVSPATKEATTPIAAFEPVPIPLDEQETLPPGDERLEASEARLPDLRTLPPDDLAVRRLSRSRRVLRLANTVWNNGQGPLELVGELNPITQQTQVRQRVHTENGEPQEYVVGEFIWHPRHDHWHFEQFAVYQLWSLSEYGELQRVVASSTKLSYCLIDTDIIARSRLDDVRRRYYGCGRKLQGLSVGWGDRYESNLDGQSLEITHLSDGLYALTSTTNPNATLLEADYTNNTAVVYLRLAGNSVTVLPSAAFETGRCRADGWC